MSERLILLTVPFYMHIVFILVSQITSELLLHSWHAINFIFLARKHSSINLFQDTKLLQSNNEHFILSIVLTAMRYNDKNYRIYGAVACHETVVIN